MSGRSKRILYRCVSALLYLAAIGGMFAVLFFRLSGVSEGEMIAFNAALLCVVLHISVLVHEAGHLLFGSLAGMKCASFRISPFSEPAGRTEMFPKNGKGVKGKFFMEALGGAALNLLLGGVLLALFWLLPYHPALLFCGVFAPFLICEGICALLPCELPSGKTDGAVLFGLMKNRPDEEVALRVLTAQGILYRGLFSEIREETLFSVPVVREDLPAYHALLFLRAQYRLSEGREEEAREELSRLLTAEGTMEGEREEARRYLGLFEGRFESEPTPLRGVEILEKELERQKKFCG